MAWAPRTRIGGYEIVGALGAGGMGEVYRARDIRLQRDVALKILPSLFVTDPERRARFEREARVLASLNHPNIAAIYGIEEAADGGERTPVLVLELVEGETLQGRLARGPLALDDALAIALRISDALEAAHDKGIVHRDLKPANVQIAPDGTVKVLDFGLARPLDDGHARGTEDSARSPTLTSPPTELGMILGTAAYMAPEQARGQPVDRRADIWAFGAVLYEMLAGTRPFPGETVSDTLAAVLTTNPDWTRLRSDTPPAVRRLLERCLHRDPRQRLQAIGEARIVLSSPNQLIDAPPGRASGNLLVAGLVAAALALGGLAGAWWFGTQPSSSEPTGAARKFDLMLDGLEFNIDAAPVLSPDGQRIVYRANGRWWLRALTEFVPKPLPASSGAAYAFWSPDSRQVAFVRDGRISRVGIGDNEATPVGAVPADLTGTGGGVWTTAGDLVLAGSDSVGLFAIPASGGAGREILPLDRSQESDFHDVTELPGGRGLLFTVHRVQGADTIAVLADGTRRNLVQIAGESLRSPIYSPAGYLLYARETISPGVWAVRFSLSRLATEGDPVLVVPGGGMPSLGADGTLVFIRPSSRPSQIVWIDRRGSIEPVGDLPAEVARAGPYATLGQSPDRERIAIALRTTGGTELFAYDLVRRTMPRLSVGAGTVISPTWSADGRRVFYGSFAGSRASNVHAAASHETRAPERVLPPSDLWRYPCSVSPDGRWLLYAEGIASTDLWVAPLAGGAAPQRLMHTPSFRETDAKFSPDGRWIAYTSDESGRLEIYVRAFPIDAHRVQVSEGGATMPAWSPDGQEILYRTATAMVSVKLTKTGSGFDTSAPRQLFPISDAQFLNAYGVSADGQRFLFIRSAGNDRVSVLLNWAAHVGELARPR